MLCYEPATGTICRQLSSEQPRAFDPIVAVCKLNAAIEEFYGRGGRGMLKRIGKASNMPQREQAALPGPSRAWR
ncbi:MAG: hypothetical protein U0V48_10350 [Anaerolineales bacterium]